MEVSKGRIVLYTLTEEDATQINRRRTSGADIAVRIKNNTVTAGEQRLSAPFPAQWPIGAQAHIGNMVDGGFVFPAIVVRHTGNVVNAQVFLDGNDTFWIEDKQEGEGRGEWHWPPRV